MNEVLTHDEIVAREKALYDSCVEKKKDPVFAIAQDRDKRWKSFLEGFEVRPEIAKWAEDMTAKYRFTYCRMENSTVSWVLALLLTRYGFAEYHWPVDGFSDDDVRRAKEWLAGKSPEHCVYFE